MPYAVTHIITSLTSINIFRKKILKKKEFPLWLLLIGGLSGLLPDIDFLGYWFLTAIGSLQAETIHSAYTHTFLIPLLLMMISLCLWKWKTLQHTVWVISVGYTIHILLDIIFANKPVFFPFSNKDIGLQLIPEPYLLSFYISLDAIVLILWLVYEWRYKKIKDYS